MPFLSRSVQTAPATTIERADSFFMIILVVPSKSASGQYDLTHGTLRTPWKRARVGSCGSWRSIGSQSGPFLIPSISIGYLIAHEFVRIPLPQMPLHRFMCARCLGRLSMRCMSKLDSSHPHNRPKCFNNVISWCDIIVFDV